MPTLSVAKPGLVTAEPPVRGFVSVYRPAPLHVESVGSNSVNVTVPVGLFPPETVAESFSVTPMVPELGFGVVEIDGVALLTTLASSASLQAVVAFVLFASPLV